MVRLIGLDLLIVNLIAYLAHLPDYAFFFEIVKIAGGSGIGNAKQFLHFIIGNFIFSGDELFDFGQISMFGG